MFFCGGYFNLDNATLQHEGMMQCVASSGNQHARLFLAEHPRRLQHIASPTPLPVIISTTATDARVSDIKRLSNTEKAALEKPFLGLADSDDNAVGAI